MARACLLAPVASLFFVGGCVDLVHNDRLDEALVRTLHEPRRGGGRIADVAIALGCPSDDETGALSSCERCRVGSALRAYREGEVAAVIFTGGAAHNRFVEADVMAEAAISAGIPARAIEREPRALTTWMNLRYAQRIMGRRGWRSALVLTTAAHLPRARRFADHYGIEARYRACDLDEAAGVSLSAR